MVIWSELALQNFSDGLLKIIHLKKKNIAENNHEFCLNAV